MDTYTYLGIKLDEQINFTSHGNTIITKVSNKIYHLRKIRPFLNKKAATLIYKNMILPILEYGDVLVDSMSVEIKKKLQTLQNRALRCALNKDKGANTNELHAEAKLKTERAHLASHVPNVARKTV